jgi:hypothetical protein
MARKKNIACSLAFTALIIDHFFNGQNSLYTGISISKVVGHPKPPKKRP